MSSSLGIYSMPPLDVAYHLAQPLLVLCAAPFSHAGANNLDTATRGVSNSQRL